MIVAQREIAEFHNTPPFDFAVARARFRFPSTIDAFAIVVNAT
jgi:hypothetical protein